MANDVDKDLLNLLYNAGFRDPKALQQAYAVAMAESNARPKAHNPDASTGDNSYGMFQINMLGNLGPERNAKFKEKIPGYVDEKSLFDPNINARAAAYMSRAGKTPGTDWSGWSTYGGKRYNSLLPDLKVVTDVSRQFAPIKDRWGPDVAYKGSDASYSGGGKSVNSGANVEGSNANTQTPATPPGKDTYSQDDSIGQTSRNSSFSSGTNWEAASPNITSRIA